MAKKAIIGALSDLSKSELEEFCSALTDRKDQPRIRKNAVENKSIVQVSEKIVATYTVDRAVGVVVEILREINNEVADELEESYASK